MTIFFWFFLGNNDGGHMVLNQTFTIGNAFSFLNFTSFKLSCLGIYISFHLNCMSTFLMKNLACTCLKSTVGLVEVIW